MKGVGAVAFLLVLAGAADAGELVLANGSRIEGVLANEVLVVSTGTDLIEVAPEQVGVLTGDEIWLRNGHVIRGTLVGGHVKVQTPVGEMAVKAGELRVFRAEGIASAAPAESMVVAALPEASRPQGPGRRLEVVVSEISLQRDALVNAEAVGRAVRGDQVTYVDFIDRRLRIFNVLVYDGGHWIKVRAADGSVGWLPAQAVREIR